MRLTRTGNGGASFRQQASIFSFLNLFVIAALPLLHVLLTSYLGRLPPVLFVALGLGFLFHVTVFIWIQTRSDSIADRMVVYLTLSSIAVNSAITIVAATTSNQDSQYFALMIIPILEASFRFSFPATLAVVLLADSLNFYWVWITYRVNLSPQFNEYVEAGTVSLIYTLVGVIVWLLVNRLRQKEAHLAHSVEELERARKRLSEEEKLAAVGRLSSAIAHEIRNPVAMISSSLAMAYENGLTAEGRKEMFDIAAKEATRLEKLTSDFLEYAKPQVIERTDSSALDSLLYVAGACKAYASETGVYVTVDDLRDLTVSMDAGKIQQALLNLAKNAIEASSAGQTVALRVLQTNEEIWLEVENLGTPIPEEVLSQIFEPFFTTKRRGTGLGLAIARNIARAHGGDLVLRVNELGRVCFSLQLPTTEKAQESAQERTWAAS
jgi:two-component system, NtrC family, sensor histidine kinase HydH